MKKYYILLAITIMNSVNADVPLEQKHEIEHLVNFLKNTTCQVSRNGKYHKGAEVVAHIQKKYDYFRDKIGTPKQFIDYSATKSMMSGKYYMVKCDQQPPQKSRDWLLNELRKYRESKNRH